MSQLIYRGNEYIFHEPSEEMLFRTHCVLTAEPPSPSLPEVLGSQLCHRSLGMQTMLGQNIDLVY